MVVVDILFEAATTHYGVIQLIYSKSYFVPATVASMKAMARIRVYHFMLHLDITTAVTIHLAAQILVFMKPRLLTIYN